MTFLKQMQCNRKTSVEFKFSAPHIRNPYSTLSRFTRKPEEKHDKSRQRDDRKEGGRCHRVEINMVEHDRVKRGGLAPCGIDARRIWVSRWSRRGVRVHLTLSLVCSTLHLTLQQCEFVWGNQAEELLFQVVSSDLCHTTPHRAPAFVTQEKQSVGGI